MAAVSGLQAMAAAASSVAGLSSSGNGVSSSRVELGALRGRSRSAMPVRQERTATVTTRSMASVATKDPPDMGKRQLMNYLLLGAIGLPSVSMIGPFLYFLVPPGAGGGGAGVTAKDALGNDITAVGWLQKHPPGDRTLAQGLKGDPTYLVVENDGKLAGYGINAVCTHLGCVVPYNNAEKKFICPCHGSQYNQQGRVVRGPAPLSLPLAVVSITEGNVVFSTWEDTDFRNGEKPWWS